MHGCIGQEMMRLDFHGGIGYFCHAILEIHRLDGSTEPQYQTIDLKFLSTEDVKRFIEDYLAARAACGFGVVEDTNADFYQAMNPNFSNNQPPMLALPPVDDVPMPQAIVPDPALNVPSVPLYVGLRDEPPVSKGKKRKQTPLAIQVLSLIPQFIIVKYYRIGTCYLCYKEPFAMCLEFCV